MNSLLLALSAGYIALIVIGSLLLCFLIIMLILVPIKPWFMALVSGTYISMGRLIGMRLRKVDTKNIVLTYIMARKAGLTISIVDLETHYMAGGNIDKVVKALIAAHSAKIDLDIELAKAIDLAGSDVVEAVETCVTPKIIEVNDIAAIAQDGIEVRVDIKVTVKTNIKELVGGAREDTIVARVGKGIVSCIGAAETYNDLLENPASISEKIQIMGLDDGTAYDIISIDVADIDIGRNLGAKLETEEAEKNKVLAQAQAERIRQIAVAEEQKMKAKTQEMKAAVLAAEAEIPKAIAEAIKNGNFGVLDYYKLQNLQADTAMRNSIAGSDNSDSDEDDE